MASSYFAGALSTLSKLASVPETTPTPSAPPHAKARRVRPLTDIDLHGGKSHSDDIAAFCGSERLSLLGHSVRATWYRVRDGAHFEPLDASGGVYSPCLDDVGSRILCRVREVENPNNSGFGELGPIEADAAILSRAQSLFENETATIEAEGIMDDAPPLAVELRVSSEAVIAVPAARLHVVSTESPEPEVSPVFSVSEAHFPRISVRLDGKTGLQLSVAPAPSISNVVCDSESSSDAQIIASMTTLQRLCLQFRSTAARDVAAITVRKFVGLDMFGRDAQLSDDPRSIAPSGAETSSAAEIETPQEDELQVEAAACSTATSANFSVGGSDEAQSALPAQPVADQTSAAERNRGSIEMPPPVLSADSIGADSVSPVIALLPVSLEAGYCNLERPIVTGHPTDHVTSSASVSPPAEQLALQRQVAQLTEQLGATQRTADAAAAQVSALTRDLKMNAVTIHRLRDEVSSSLARYDVASASAHAKTAEIKRLAAQLASAEATVTSAAAETASWKQRHMQASASAAESSGAASALGRLQRELQALTASLSAMRTERDAARADAREANEKLEAIRVDVASRAKAAARWQQDADALRARVECLVAERDSATKELQAAIAQRNDARAAATAAEASLLESVRDREALDRVVNSSRVERDDLCSALQACSARCASMEHDLKAAREQAEAAAARALAAGADLDALRSKLAEQSKAVDLLAREKADAATRAASLEVEACELRGRAQAAESKLKRLTAAADASKALLAQQAALQDQLDSVTAERNAAVKKAESLRRDVARMTSSSEELKTIDIGELVRAKRALEEKVVRMSAEALALNERLEALLTSGSSSSSTAKGGGVLLEPPSGGSRGTAASDVALSSPVRALPAPVYSAFVSSPHAPPLAHDESSKVRELQRLANTLLEQLSDSADALKQQRATKEALAARIHELERQLAVRGQY